MSSILSWKVVNCYKSFYKLTYSTSPISTAAIGVGIRKTKTATRLLRQMDPPKFLSGTSKASLRVLLANQDCCLFNIKSEMMSSSKSDSILDFMLRLMFKTRMSSLISERDRNTSSSFKSLKSNIFALLVTNHFCDE